MIRKENLSEILKSNGIKISDDILQKKIESPETQEKIDEVKRRYSFKIWDKIESINGVAANVVIASIPMINTAISVYLILENNEVVVIEPCEANEKDIPDIAKRHIEKIAEDAVMLDIISDLSQEHSEKPNEVTMEELKKQIDILKGSIIEITSAVMGGEE